MSRVCSQCHLDFAYQLLSFNFCPHSQQVGAAISMTYITGQPIVFVGTGQTYPDLKSLNAKAVVHALMK